MMAKYVLLAIVMFTVLAVTECYYTDVSIVCSSIDYQYKTCDISTPGFYNDIEITEIYSTANCTKCESFGFRDNHVWVAKGCRGKFKVRVCRKYTVLDCDSYNYARKECAVTTGASNVSYVLLASRRSEAACTKDTSYGIIGNKIWVHHGCRGTFHVCFE